MLELPISIDLQLNPEKRIAKRNIRLEMAILYEKSDDGEWTFSRWRGFSGGLMLLTDESVSRPALSKLKID